MAENAKYTYGQQAVRLDYRRLEGVEEAEIVFFKEITAKIIDDLHIKRKTSQSDEQKALLTLAIRRYQTALRDTVFAITHKDIDLLN